MNCAGCLTFLEGRSKIIDGTSFLFDAMQNSAGV
jgi:hypothetical protein